MRTKLYVVVGVWYGVIDHVSVHFDRRVAEARANLLWKEYQDVNACDVDIREVEIDLDLLQPLMGTSG